MCAPVHCPGWRRWPRTARWATTDPPRLPNVPSRASPMTDRYRPHRCPCVAGTVGVQPRPGRAHRAIGSGRRTSGQLDSRRQRARRHPSPSDRQGQPVQHGHPIRRRSPDDRRPAIGPGGLDPHGRRRRGHRRAPCGCNLVPGQRPPERQGHLRHQDHRSCRAAGHLKRHAVRHAHPQRQDHLELARPRTHGVLPGHGHRREVRAEFLSSERDLLRRRHRPRPVRAGRQPDDRRALLVFAGREFQLQAADANDQRPGRWGAAVLLGHQGHRAGLGLHLRRGAHRGRG